MPSFDGGAPRSFIPWNFSGRVAYHRYRDKQQACPSRLSRRVSTHRGVRVDGRRPRLHRRVPYPRHTREADRETRPGSDHRLRSVRDAHGFLVDKIDFASDKTKPTRVILMTWDLADVGLAGGIHKAETEGCKLWTAFVAPTHREPATVATLLASLQVDNAEQIFRPSVMPAVAASASLRKDGTWQPARGRILPAWAECEIAPVAGPSGTESTLPKGYSEGSEWQSHGRFSKTGIRLRRPRRDGAHGGSRRVPGD